MYITMNINNFKFLIRFIVIAYCCYSNCVQCNFLDDSVNLIKVCKNEYLENCLKKKILVQLDGLLHSNVSLFWGLVNFEVGNETNNLDTRKLNEEYLTSVFAGREIQDVSSSLESMLISKFIKFFQTHSLYVQEPDEETSRGMMRTIRRVRRLLMPLLIGVKLKLAAFLPFKFAILAALAAISFGSGSTSLLLSIATIVYNYFHGKSYGHYSFDTSSIFDFMGGGHGNGHHSMESHYGHHGHDSGPYASFNHYHKQPPMGGESGFYGSFNHKHHPTTTNSRYKTNEPDKSINDKLKRIY